MHSLFYIHQTTKVIRELRAKRGSSTAIDIEVGHASHSYNIHMIMSTLVAQVGRAPV